ncbi:glycoside hydrolase family 140 protein [Opitutus terrae]|uniref:DUF4038 domain-containing protein n=1 Tax=Opitutus terrae (strain DSM 11246 / JCM 15787 / PB90-1) TaxID=452637 RepID=B1ZZE1_OPITP|nr:glycoside hydrolase family 140 protein [Opitutus terrae]ACB76344.1 conserved hypothetical protein [Opitutus terrae PB90-1]
MISISPVAAADAAHRTLRALAATCWAATCVCAVIAASAAVAQAAAPRLKVDPTTQRFLVYEDGRPFFYLADTAWELFHRLKIDEAREYLDDRAVKGFTVIQAVALAELDGLHTPNAYGHLPLIDDDPTRPAEQPGPNNDYWDHVDAIVDEAAQRGMFIGLLPTWGDKWNLAKWGKGPVIFTPENAEWYGEWIGRRYRDKPVIWILGGDRPIENDTHRQIIEAMVRGLRRGDGGAHLITFHPRGGDSSSRWFHGAGWLDFNMRQNGHEVNSLRYVGTRADYDLSPTKPVIDGEPIYEDHPIEFDAPKNGHSVAADCRRALYWDLFSGACGHTYGHHSVWQMAAPEREPVNMPLLSWRAALQQPGAGQMQHARRLLESRPVLTRIPDDALIVSDEPATAVPGAGRYRMVGTRDRSGSWAAIYVPVGRPFTVKTSLLTGERLNVWWFSPRTGAATAAGQIARADTHRFVPPDPGESLDWVLVLDDASQDFPAPGAR